MERLRRSRRDRAQEIFTRGGVTGDLRTQFRGEVGSPFSFETVLRRQKDVERREMDPPVVADLHATNFALAAETGDVVTAQSRSLCGLSRRVVARTINNDGVGHTFERDPDRVPAGHFKMAASLHGAWFQVVSTVGCSWRSRHRRSRKRGTPMYNSYGSPPSTCKQRWRRSKKSSISSISSGRDRPSNLGYASQLAETG